MPHSATVTPEMRQCITSCLDCHAICIETAIHCLTMGGKHAEVSHQRLMQDCAQICLTSAGFMLRGSEHHKRTCGLCAEICRACAKDCEKIADGDAMMLKCVEVCRRCAISCDSMS